MAPRALEGILEELAWAYANHPEYGLEPRAVSPVTSATAKRAQCHRSRHLIVPTWLEDRLSS